MKISDNLTKISTNHPKFVTVFIIFITSILFLLTLLPSISPKSFPFLNPLKVDTDPENMLPESEPVRVFHNKMKKEFSLYEIIVVGVVNEVNEQGVFNPESLNKIYELTEFAKTLKWKNKNDPSKEEGVISVDMISPSMVDNIEQGGIGEVKFEWLMNKPPKTLEEALNIKNKAERIPFLKGTLLSENGKAICLYLPITHKNVSNKIYNLLNKKIQEFKGSDKFYITGLPVANDTFGVEMFKQMAMSAPLAMLIIFILMFLFFRKLVLIISPMIIAIVSVICTMGLLIITGNTVHIMSSMIPIFIMPIAVLDSVHILSEFFDKYPKIKDRKKTIFEVMDELFMPMLYTSLTSMAGFASLALTPIPPVQVFGIFVAIGVLFAWVLTVVFIPSYIMFIKDSSLTNFGHIETHEENPKGLSKLLKAFGNFTYTQSKLIFIITFIIIIVAVYGISKIQINDNPVKWFTSSHPIRIADKELNKHFGGTYMAYLYLDKLDGKESIESYLKTLKNKSDSYSELKNDIPKIKFIFEKIINEAYKYKLEKDINKILEKIESYVSDQLDNASDEEYDAWDEAFIFISKEKNRDAIFKDPLVLRYIDKLNKHLMKSGVVGKINSISDVVKTVHRELFSGFEKDFRIPDTREAVAQCLITYQNSHRPQDLWHFVTTDYTKSNLWIQLKSGNNKDMLKAIDCVDTFFKNNPPPIKLRHKWFGLTYINVVWQNKMVAGMLKALLGSFFVVFLMMVILFRSALWGILSMIPLTITIGFIYGVVGLVGKDYDMPIAVLSSLTLGLAVDFAIHFLARCKDMYEQKGSWKELIGDLFDEPARAISRNIVVIALGFLPLLFAPLVPYKTVGVFLATILIVAGITTLFILPALIKVFEKKLFPDIENSKIVCRCTTCIIVAITSVFVIVINLHEYINIGYTKLTILSIVSIVILSFICMKMSKTSYCEKKE